jgi:hypothetical protein
MRIQLDPTTFTPTDTPSGIIVGKWKILVDGVHFANAYLYVVNNDERWWITAPRGDFNDARCFISHASGNLVANVTLPRAVRLCDWVRAQCYALGKAEAV